MSIIKDIGIDIYYELHGHGEPLVLIAGYTCDHAVWMAILEELARHFQVLIFDNRAAGQTKDDGRAFTLDTLAADTMALVQALDLKRPHIVGQSMGGMIAQTIGKNYSAQINKLVILNSAAKTNNTALIALAVTLKLRKANISLDLIIDTILPWIFSGDFLTAPCNTELLKKTLMENPFPQSLADQERQFQALQKFDARAWSRENKMPALVIAAEHDAIMPIHESQQFAESLTNSKFVKVPGGHASQMEQPGLVNKAIVEFLK